MGGFGSGWRRATTDIVEDCLVLSIADLVREKVIVSGAVGRGVLAWSRAGQQPDAQVNYEADLLTDKHAAIQLRYRIDDRDESSNVWLRYTEPQISAGNNRHYCRSNCRGHKIPTRVPTLEAPFYSGGAAQYCAKRGGGYHPSGVRGKLAVVARLSVWSKWCVRI